jgi:hypothetical protein
VLYIALESLCTLISYVLIERFGLISIQNEKVSFRCRILAVQLSVINLSPQQIVFSVTMLEVLSTPFHTIWSERPGKRDDVKLTNEASKARDQPDTTKPRTNFHVAQDPKSIKITTDVHGNTVIDVAPHYRAVPEFAFYIDVHGASRSSSRIYVKPAAPQMSSRKKAAADTDWVEINGIEMLLCNDVTSSGERWLNVAQKV